MNNSVLQQAQLLISRHRYKDAEELIRSTISQDIENAMAYSLLAIVLVSQDKAKEGLPAAQHAIALEPNSSYHYFAYSFVLGKLRKYEDAVREVQTALRLDPLNAHYHAHLSSLFLQLKEWKRALEAAKKGLELDPQNDMCANYRAMALTHLGEGAQAAHSIDGLLSRNPENALSHANQGWTSLHQGNPRQALVHFREALRLQPDMDWARRGTLEALKARNIIYRWVLAYYLWISRFKANVQWALILGAFFGIRIVRAIGAANPALAPWLSIVIFAYIVFVFSTWVASPLFNLFLRLDPFGRMVLDERELKMSNWVGVAILAALGFGVSGWISGLSSFTGAAVGAFAMILPISALARAETKSTQTILGIYALLLAIAGLVWLALSFLGLDNPAGSFLTLFLIGWILNNWLASYLISRERA